MAHILCKIRNVDIKLLEALLKEHAPMHAKEGQTLEHIWQNADDKNEVLFLFKSKNLAKAKKIMETRHKDALKADPKANLPEVTYLK